MRYWPKPFMHARRYPTSEESVDSDIRPYRWGSLLLCEGKGETRLSSDALGRAALAIMRSQNTTSRVEPETLYDQGQYLACCQVLQQAGVVFNSVLVKAAEMLAEVFKDSPRSEEHTS